MSDCSNSRMDPYRRCEIRVEFEDGMPPLKYPFALNGRSISGVYVDGVRFERVSECEWVLMEKWANDGGDEYVYGYETGCGARHTWWPERLPNFCPSCGAKVKEAE